jgi:hypothetical protein
LYHFGRKKAVARNSRRRRTVYPRFLTSRARASTARRIRPMFASGFDNLLMSAAELHTQR